MSLAHCYVPELQLKASFPPQAARETPSDVSPMTRDPSGRYADVRLRGAIEGTELLQSFSFVTVGDIRWHPGSPAGLVA